MRAAIRYIIALVRYVVAMAWYLALHSIGDKTLPAAREAAMKAKKRLHEEEKR